MASESLSPVISKFFTANSRGANAVSDVELRSFQASGPSQTPHLLFIGCSDSRVPESTVFLSEPGDVFVHRNIANQFHTDDDNALSVMTYGLQALHIRDVIVVGHTDCGGAKFSYEAATADPVPPTGPIERWLAPLTALAGTLPSTVPRPPPGTPEYERELRLVIDENVKAQVRHVKEIARALGLPATVRIQGGVYGIETGELIPVGQQVNVIGTEA